ncbi:type 4a pilus biogenesis protein PilO [Candidatus Omnitrophota bacterium]
MKKIKIDIQGLLNSKKGMNVQGLLNKITQDKKILAASILAILAILYLDFSFALQPQMRALKAINPKILTVKKELAQLNADSIRMQRHTRGSAPIKLKEMVHNGQTPLVIEEISRMANQQGVEILQIKPGRQVKRSASAKNTVQLDGYALTMIDLVVSAPYHQLGKFLSELENYNVFLEVGELNIERDEDEALQHEIKLQLKTYVSEK